MIRFLQVEQGAGGSRQLRMGVLTHESRSSWMQVNIRAHAHSLQLHGGITQESTSSAWQMLLLWFSYENSR